MLSLIAVSLIKYHLYSISSLQKYWLNVNHKKWLSISAYIRMMFLRISTCTIEVYSQLLYSATKYTESCENYKALSYVMPVRNHVKLWIVFKFFFCFLFSGILFFSNDTVGGKLSTLKSKCRTKRSIDFVVMFLLFLKHIKRNTIALFRITSYTFFLCPRWRVVWQ